MICLCETWLNDTFHSGELVDDRYMVYRKDRSKEFKVMYNKAQGGGVLIAIKKTIKSVHLPECETSNENIWVRIYLKRSYINICVVYLPSYITNIEFSDFLKISDDNITNAGNNHTFIIGDFNLPEIN